jgi:putative ABC transport system permease protein
VYPNLLVPLLSIVAVFVAALLYAVAFRPVARRLAFRQLARRRNEALLAIGGATLGTAIIAGALVVGDTLNFSVRQEAYRTLGAVDERVISPDAGTGAFAARTLAPLRADPRIDGMLTAQVDGAAALSGTGTGQRAEPRVLAWDVDFAAAARFGGADSGLSGAAPAGNHVYINEPLAGVLHVSTGDSVRLFLYGRAHTFVVARVIPEQGLAGAGLGASVNRNVFLPKGTLEAAAYHAGNRPQVVTFVSNRGGVESGADLTAPVSSALRTDLARAGIPAVVETPKQSVLDAATKTGDALGALFLMIGSFSIIAGSLLLVNIFTMLAEERKSQLGMLRAVGMRRSSLVQSFGLEGATYAVAAAVPGVLLGLGVGWVVARISAQIFRSWSANGSNLDIQFAVTPTSVANAIALGLVIAFVTILATAVRISRFNVIAAIRDLPATTGSRSRRLVLVLSSVAALLITAVAVPAVVTSQAEATFLLPCLAAVLAYPALRRLVSSRWAITAVAGGCLVWTLVAPVLRPRIFDTPSMAIFVIEGTLAAFSGVALLSQNQSALLRPVRGLLDRASENGLALRLATAYPLAKRFRTGATLVMYTLITLVLVLLVEITGVINHSTDMNVAQTTAGYTLRLDFDATAGQRVLADLRGGPFADQVSAAVPLLSAPALAGDPGHRTTAQLKAQAIGIPAGATTAMTMSDRLAGVPTDAAVWRLVATDTRYVLLDQFFNAGGGPNGRFYAPGDTFPLTNPITGRTETKTIAGILSSALAFYPSNGVAAYPIVTSTRAVHELFGSAAAVNSALLRAPAGTDAEHLAAALQARYLPDSLVATSLAANARAMFAANTAFFRLMQGFLALGLLVGICGLGVVMVRAVHERRRTIGVLRALGFQARTVRRSFLAESGFIAGEGVALGAVLGVLTTWLMYQKSAAFDGVRAGFTVEWATIAVLCLATFLASLIATLGPARRAAAVLPALAVRVTG